MTAKEIYQRNATDCMPCRSFYLFTFYFIPHPPPPSIPPHRLSRMTAWEHSRPDKPLTTGYLTVLIPVKALSTTKWFFCGFLVYFFFFISHETDVIVGLLLHFPAMFFDLAEEAASLPLFFFFQFLWLFWFL